MMWEASLANQHSAFILADRRRPTQFKVGSGVTPGTLAKEEARRRYGTSRNAARAVHVHVAWKFQSCHAALHVEQAIIELVRRFDYPEIDEAQWFEIDPGGLAFVTTVAGHFVDAIHQAENHLRLSSPAPNPEKPYGRYRLQQTLRRFSTMAQEGRTTVPSSIAELRSRRRPHNADG